MKNLLKQFTRLSKKVIFILSAVLLAGLGIFVYSYFFSKSAKAAWFDENWLYRKAVSIANTGILQTDFQVSFTIDTATLITAGKLRSDCGDLRVTDQGGTSLPYWIEENNPGCNSASTKVWTKIPFSFITGATVYVYYGNPSASSAQNPSKVFEFFDDFTASSVNTNKWTTSGSPTVSAGVLSLVNNAKLSSLSNLSNTDGTRTLGFRAKMGSTSLTTARLGFSNTSSLASGYSTDDSAHVLLGNEQAYQTFIGGSNLTSYHQLEETTTTDANQFKASGYLDTGKLSQAVSMYGNAAQTARSQLTFNSGSQISGNNYEHINNNQGSMSFWFKPNWNGNDGKERILFTNNSTGAPQIWKSTGNILILALVNIANYGNVNISGWTSGTWYFITARWNANNTISGSNYVCLGINGTETCGRTSAWTPSTPRAINYIGGWQNETYAADGLIDDFAIYDRVLTTTEITSLYNSGTGNEAGYVADPALKFYAKMDGSGTLSPVTYNAGTSASKMTRTSSELTGGTNLVADGNMEAASSGSPTGWTVQALVTAADAESTNILFDTRSQKITNTDTVSTRGIYQTISGLTAGNNYVLSGWMKATAGTAYLRAYSSDDLVEIGTVTTTSSTWQPFSLAVKIPAGKTGLNIWAQVTNNNGTAYFDNIVITPNLVDNGGMEGTYIACGSGNGNCAPGGWNVYTSGGAVASGSVSSTAHSGSSSQAITVTNGSYTNIDIANLALTVGNYYLASVWVRSDTPSKSVYLTYWNNTSGIYGPSFIFPAADTWYRLSFVIKATASTSQQFSVVTINSGFTYLVDDFSVIPLDNTSLAFKSWAPVTDTSSNANDLSVQGGSVGVGTTVGEYGNGYKFDGSTGYLRQKTYATNIGDLSYSGNTLADTGQTFTSYKTSSGNASYMIVVTNSDNTTSWGYIGNNSEAANTVSVYTTKDRSTLGWNGTSPTGKTPVGYEIRKTDYQITGNLTVGAWLKPPNFSGTAISASHNGGYLFFYPFGTDVRFYVYTNAWHYVVIPQASISLNQFTYFVMTYNQTNLSVYMNGVLQGTPLGVSGTIPYDVSPFVLGGYTDISSVTQLFNGAIDSPFVLSTALTADQIKALYNVSSPKYGLANSHTSLSGFGDGSSYSVDTNYHTFEITQKSSSVDFSVDGGSAVTSSTNPPTSNEYIRLENSDPTNTVSLDYLYVRKTYSTAPSASVSATEEQGPGPVGYWKFDEGVGTTAYDSSFSRNNGIINGATWQTEDQCISGKCLKFDGISNYVTVPDNKSLSPGSSDYVASAWIKTSASYSSTIGWIYSNYGSNTNNQVAIYINTDNKLGCQYRDGSVNTASVTGAGNILNDSKWHFVSCVRSGTSVIAYIDGSQVGTGSNSSLGTINTTGASKSIGAISTNHTQLFNGFIDEPKIYPYARTAAQIKTDYLSGKANASAHSGTSAALGAKPQQFMSEGLVGYWKMDETSGTSVVDSSGNSNTGTLTSAQETGTAQTGGSTTTILDGANASLSSTDSVYNGMIVNITGGTCGITTGTQRTISAYTGATKTITVSSAFSAVTDGCTYQILHQAGGKYGNGMQFDGENDYINLATPASLQPSKITLVTWFKSNSTAVSRIIRSRGYGYSLLLNNPSVGKVQFSVWDSSSTSININSSQNYNDNNWHQAIATYDSNEARLYVDGMIVASSAGVQNGSIYYQTAGISLGRDGDFSGNYYKGVLDETRIYNRALSPDEIRQLADWAPGPVGYWKMDDKVSGNSKTIVDSSGYGNNGTTYYGANATGMDCTKVGKYGGACSFDGVDDYVDAGNSANLNIKSAITVEGWFKPNGQPSADWTPLFGKAASWYIHTDTAANYNKHFFQIKTAGQNASTFTLTPSYTTPDNNWHYYTGTYDSATGQVLFYVDGVVKGTATGVGQLADSVSRNMLISGMDSRYTNGYIDDVKIYNYARTQKQIVEDINGGHPSVGSPVGSALGYWKFDEGYGTTANNSGSQGQALQGTLTNMASPATSTSGWTNSGKFGKTLNFDGTNDYVSIPNSASLSPGSGNYTVSAWIKTSTNYSGSIGWIFSNYGSNTNNVVQLAINTDNKPICTYRDGSANAASINTQGNALNDNQWHHVLCTRTGTTAAEYVDGKQIGANTNSNLGTIDTTGSTKSIGAIASDHSQLFTGSIDEVKVYNYALTADEVKTEYNHGSALALGSLGNNSNSQTQSASQEYCIPGDTTSCAAPVGRWDFEEKQGGTVNDTSGNNNTGTWNGTGTTHWTTGKVGAAGQFNGMDDYVDIGDSTILDSPATSNKITVEGWIKMDSLGSIIHTIAQKGANEQYGFWLGPDTRGGSPHRVWWEIGDGISGHYMTCLKNYSFNTNVWYHMVGIYDGTSQYIYINGRSLGSCTQNISMVFDTRHLYLGSAYGINYYTTGKIDQVRIYNYARTAAQIAYDYNRGAPVGWWKFDECQGTTAHDSSSNSNNGTITIGATGTQTSAGTCTDGLSTSTWNNGKTGKRNYSLNFDGTDDYVRAGTTGISSTTGSTSLWIKPTTTPSTDAVVFMGSTFPNRVYVMRLATSSNFGLRLGSSNTVDTGKSISINSWSHLIITWSSGTYFAYLNGTQVATGSYSGLDSIGSCSTIGVYSDCGSIVANPFNGQVDDVRVYNYALTATQVKNLYNCDAAVCFAPLTGSP